MAIDPDQIEHLQELIATLRRRQRILENQRAGYGELAVPAHIELELENITQQLLRYEADLRRLHPSPDRIDAPYVGLLTFQENDAARFFGRDTFVAELAERVRSSPFLAVLGASGSGKSSLVRAGLIPLLRGGALNGSAGWQYIVMKPGTRPLDVLATELAKIQGNNLDLALRLSHSLAESERALLLATDMLLDRANGQRLVLVVDQFEELWTQTPAEQRDTFIKLLLVATDPVDAPLLLIVTMRADFLHRAIELRSLAERIERHVVLVSPMQPVEIRAAIERPIDNVGSFEAGLVDELIEQVKDRPGALPLLEFTLLELWKRREPHGIITWKAYHDLGGVEGALAARADAILKEHYTPEQQAELRQLLLRLVQPGEGAADTRRRVRLEDLAPAGTSLEAVQRLLKPLVDERLLVTTGEGTERQGNKKDGREGEEVKRRRTTDNRQSIMDNGQNAIIEISHEALIRAWPTFGHWIAEARADLRFQIQLEEASKEWEAASRNEELLWSGLRLAQADAWIERSKPLLNARDQAFLETSHAAAQARREAEEAEHRERERLLEERATAEARRAAAERRNVSRLRLFLGVGAVLLLMAIGLAVYAFNQTKAATTFAAQSARNAALSATSEAVAQANAVQSAKDRATAEAQAQISDLQAKVSESLFELGGGNADRALLLARSLVVTNTQQLLGVRAIREVVQGTIPNRSLRDSKNGFSAVAWSPDGKQIASAGFDVTIWDARTGQKVFKGNTDSMYAVAWSPNGKQIVAAGYHKVARVWNVATGEKVADLSGNTGIINAVAWSPDGKQIATGSVDKTVRVWDIATKQMVTIFNGTDSISAVAWSPNGRQIAAADGGLTIWDATTGQKVFQGDTSSVYAVAWSPDSKQIATTSSGQTASILDVATKQKIVTLGGHASSVTTVTWSPDGKQIVTGSADRTARVWDVATGQTVAILEGHTDAIYTVSWSPDGRQIVTGSADKTAKVWDITVGKATVVLAGHADSVNGVTWSPDGKQVATGSFDGTARVWDTTTGLTVAKLKGDDDRVNAIAWSPDRKRVVTASWTATVWDVATQQAIAHLNNLPNAFKAVAWSPDGKSVALGSSEGITIIWDGVKEQANTILGDYGDEINAVAWSSDGKRLAVGSSDKTIKVWDVMRGQIVATLKDNTNSVVAIAWSPDNKQIVMSSTDKTAKVWDVTTEKVVAILKGHIGVVNAVAWSPDGKQIVTGSTDKTARVWDVATGQTVAILEGHTDVVNAVAWSPDSKQVLTGSQDGTARIWIASIQPIIAELTRRVCDVFTDEEIRTEIPAWRGCTAELIAVKDDLAEYERLRPR